MTTASSQSGSVKRRARTAAANASLVVTHCEERFRCMAEMVCDFGYEYRLQENGTLRLTWLSENFTALHGYTAEEIERDGWEPVIYPDDLPLVRQHSAEVFTGKSHTAEYRFVSKSGAVRWLRESARPLMDERTGKITRIYGAVLDITEAKRNESQVHFQASLLEQVKHAIIATDLTGKVCFWNRQAEILYQFTAAEALGKGIMELVVPHSGRARGAAILNTLAQQGYWEGEFTLRRKDGSSFPAHLVDAPIRNAQGELIGFVGVSADITERKKEQAERERLQREVEVRERRLEAFFSSSTAGLAILDRELRYLQVNRTLAEMNGCPVEAHVGKRIRDVVPALAPRLEAVFRSVLKTGRAVLNMPVSGEVPSEPGLIRYWMASYFAISGIDPAKAGVGAVVIEVTELRRTQDELRRSQQQLRALTARLQSFREQEQIRIARGIHDELGQTLTALKLDLRWVRTRLPRLARGEDSAPVIRRLGCANKLVDLMADSVQRIVADLRPTVLDRLGLVPALRQHTEQFQERTGVVCQATWPRSIPRLTEPVVTGVFRVFQELLTNVARHAKASRVRCLLKIHSGRMVLVVRDNGRGIPVEDLRARNSLGLLGMRERALLMGGTIEFRARPRQGTVATLTIPLP